MDTQGFDHESPYGPPPGSLPPAAGDDVPPPPAPPPGLAAPAQPEYGSPPGVPAYAPPGYVQPTYAQPVYGPPPGYGTPPGYPPAAGYGYYPDPTPASMIVLVVLSALAAASCYFSLAGIPAVILAAIALNTNRRDPGHARKLAKIGWWVLGGVSAFIVLAIVATIVIGLGTAGSGG